MFYLVDTMLFDNKKTQEDYKERWEKNLTLRKIKDFRFYSSKYFFENNGPKKWSLLCYMVFYDSQERLMEDMPLDREHVIRREKMNLTPDSFIKKSNAKLVNGTTIIEHVAVAKKHLKEFQNIMIQRNTPAMNFIIKHKKWCSEFIALETREVIYHDSQYPQWNQIHLITLKLVSSMFNYKKDFSKGLGLATNHEINFDENFNRLKRIRQFVYKASTKRIG